MLDDSHILTTRPSIKIAVLNSSGMIFCAFFVTIFGDNLIRAMMASVYLGTTEGSWQESFVVTTHGFAWLIAIVLGLILAVGAALQYLAVRMRFYIVSRQRLRYKRGIFSISEDEIDLGRVRDYQVLRPFWMRLLHLGDLVVHSTDRSIPILVIPGQTDPEDLRDTIRNLVLERQKAIGFREIETT